MKNRFVSGLLAVTLLLGLAGCAAPEQQNSVKETTTVKMMYYGNLDHFISLVESTYDDITIDYELSTIARFNSDGERRLRAGHGMDVVFTSLPDGEVRDYAMDLSSYEFSTRYQAATMDPVKRDGQTIFLPMPSSYYGFVINKTLIDQLGQPLPTTQQEFLNMLRLAKAENVGTGVDGCVFGTNNVDGFAVGNLLTGTVVPDFLGTMAGEKWLSDFTNHRATFAGVMDASMDFFRILAEDGLMDLSRMDSSRNVVDVQTRLSSGEMLACYGTSLYLNKIRSLTDTYEFTMLPFFSSEGNPAWITACPTSYVALNKALEEPGNEAKKDACLRILDLLSTPEGQAAILEDTQTDSSFLNEDVPSVRESETGLEPYVEAGYVYQSNRLPSNELWLLGASAVKVANGKMTVEEAMQAIDDLHENGPTESADDRTLVGGVAEDLLFEDYDTRKQETALGNLVADSVAELSGAPIALVNGGGIRASLYTGDVYASDLHAVVPYANTIVTLELPGEVLIQALENSITGIHYNQVPAGRFLQVHGIRYTIEVNPATETEETPVAAKLLSVTLEDGTPIDPDGRYTVAVNNYMCGNAGYLDGTGDGFTMLNVLSDTAPLAKDVKLIEDTGKTYEDALRAYFDHHNTEEIGAEIEGRITVNGR